MSDTEAITLENVKRTIAPGLTVYDNEGKKVGSIWQIHRAAGYFKVQVRPLPQKRDNPFDEKYVHVPFRLITTIDPRELFVSVTNDELRRDYGTPPPRATRVEEELGVEVAITTQPSGYNGLPVEVRRVQIDELRRDIRVGDRVFSTDPTELGTVKQYDAESGRITIARDALFDEPALSVPLAIVDVVNRNAQEIHLVWSEADLQRMEHLVAAPASEEVAARRP